MQAPEPEILKRKRSRPSEYWVVNADSTPQQVDQTQHKERVQNPQSGRSIQDAPTAGNRGKPMRNIADQDEKNSHTDSHNESTKLVRRGRSSGTSAELIAGLGRPTKAQKVGAKKPEIYLRGGQNVKKKEPEQRGQPGSAQDTHPPTSSESLPNLGELLQVRDAENPVIAQAEPTKASQQLRRGRSSNTTAEILGIANAIAQTGATSETRGRLAPARPRNTVAAPAGVQEGPRKRNQNAAATTDTQADSARAIKASSRTRKSTRISNVSQASESANHTTLDSEIGKKRKRGNATASPPAHNGADSSQKRKRQANPKNQAKTLPATLPREDERGRKRTRPDAAVQPVKGPTNRSKKASPLQEPDFEVQVETASSKLTKGKGKRKQDVSSSKASEANTAKSSSAAEFSVKAPKPRRISASARPKAQKKLPRSSQPPGRKRKDVDESQYSKSACSEDQSLTLAPDANEEPSKRQRVDNIDQQEGSLSGFNEPTPYPYLKETTRRVSRRTIETKWEALPPNCVDRISALLDALQNPIIARLKEDRKKTQVSVTLKNVSRRLLKKMAMGLPFPPATNRNREDDFNFEKILDHNRALESQLTPAIHANELLEAELRKEMARLESDQQNLADLETNAKNEATFRSENVRNIHSLLQMDTLSEACDLQLGLDDKEVHHSLDTSVRRLNQ